MKFLIGLILVLMGIYIEAKPQNPKDGKDHLDIKVIRHNDDSNALGAL